jgi:hypothetical protein
MIERLAAVLHVRYCAAIRVELLFAEKVGASKAACGVSIFSDTCIQVDEFGNQRNESPSTQESGQSSRSDSDFTSKCLCDVQA